MQQRVDQTASWTTETDDRFWRGPGPWGGWTAGVLLEAVLRQPDLAGVPLALNCSLMGSIDKGSVSISTRLLRKTRSLSFWTTELSQGDAHNICAQATVTIGERRETTSFQPVVMPQVPAPEKVAAPPSGFINFLSAFETRVIKGFPPLRTDGDTQSIEWVRLGTGERPLDFLLLAMLADKFPPRLFYKIGTFVPNATITMNVYFHATAAEVAEVGSDFVLLEATGRRTVGGTFDLTGTIWRRDGLLLATTEQLSWFR
jgi:hypothetical protein